MAIRADVPLCFLFPLPSSLFPYPCGEALTARRWLLRFPARRRRQVWKHAIAAAGAAIGLVASGLGWLVGRSF
jgi:hypothetical protein